MKISIFFCLFFLFLGCHRPPPADDSWVRSKVQERMDKEVSWEQTKNENAETAQKIEMLLKQELDVQQAVQIALLNNPSLQATFENLGIAQADLVEAGLFQNPIFDGYVRFPNRKHSAINTQFSITASFIDLFLIPLRKKTAQLQFEQTKLDVTNVILNLAAQVEQAFYSLQTMIAKIKIQQDLVEIASASKELAQLQVKAGNVNPLFFQSKLADIQQANLELEQTKMEMISIRKKLGVLMGLSHDNWQVLPELSKLPQQEEPIEDLEMLALKERFDVAAARKELEVIASTGAQKKWWSYTNGQIGVSTEKEPEGIQETGPAFGLSIPLFNYGQADRARLLAQYRQKQASLRALEIEVKAQVRAIQEKLMRSRRIVKYYIQSVIPVRKKILSSAQEQYNIMAIGTYDLLQAKYEELQSQLHYETSLGQYWIHRSELALAVGGNLLLRKQP